MAIKVQSANNTIRVGVSTSGSTGGVQATNDRSIYYSDLARDWAIKMDGKVQEQDYSSKYYAQDSKNSAMLAMDIVTDFDDHVQRVENDFNINAQNKIDEATIWAEGTDEQVQALGGEHSAKGWTELGGRDIEDATTNQKGIIQIATEQEADEGLNADKAMTPALVSKEISDNVGRGIVLGFDGILENNILTFAPADGIAYDLKNNYDYEIDLHFPAVGLLPDDTDVRIINGMDEIAIRNVLSGSMNATYGDLRQVCDYIEDIGWRWIFTARYKSVNSDRAFVMQATTVALQQTLENASEHTVLSSKVIADNLNIFTLQDVSFSNLEDKQILVYNSTTQKWENQQNNYTGLNFTIDKASIDETTGKSNLAYTDSLPYEVTSQLPTFASAAEATAGKDGITVSPASAYGIVGVPSYVVGGYIGTDTPVIITFNQPTKITHLNYVGGGAPSQYYDSCLYSLQASNNGSDWTTIYTGGDTSDFVDTDIDISELYTQFKFVLGWKSGSTSQYSHAAGLINLTYIKEQVQGSNYLYFNATPDNPVKAKTAQGEAFELSSVVPLNIADFTDGTYEVVLTPEGAEVTGSIYIQPQTPIEANNGDVWFNGYDAFEFVNNAWVSGFNGVRCARITVASGVIEEVYNYPYRDNGMPENIESIIDDLMPDYINGQSVNVSAGVIKTVDKPVFVLVSCRASTTSSGASIQLKDPLGNNVPSGNSGYIVSAGRYETNGAFTISANVPKDYSYTLAINNANILGVYEYPFKGDNR